jgi:hypothetical protein
MPKPTRLQWGLIAAAVLVPAAVGVALVAVPAPTLPTHVSPVSHFPPCPLPFARQTLGPEPGLRPRITNVRIADLDRDGRLDVLACDAERNRIFWYRSLGNGQWDEVSLGDEVSAPAAATPADLDGDGDSDVIVAVLDSVLPTDERVGRVVWLENAGGKFVNRVLLENVRRVSDVQAADLDGDGDTDLAVAVFGYHHGEILWLENVGGGRFRDHQLLATDGPSHVPIADFTGDGKPDIAALVSQEHEEVWVFENGGKGRFHPRRVFQSLNFDLGGVGLVPTDLDRDGKPDLLLAAGDNLEVNRHYPQPWHGCVWLRNVGDGKFEPTRIASVGGVYGAAAADFDGDGDVDVVLACMFNDWHRAWAAGLVLLTNDGRQNFTPTTIADRPINLATVAAGDLTGDGRPDIVAGALNLYTPDARDRVGRLTLWVAGGQP